MLPRIGCLCVTEDRAAVFGIALASWLTQDTPEAPSLLVSLAGTQIGAYADVARRLHCIRRVHWVNRYREVLLRLDRGASELLWRGDPRRNLVTMWDDDDWSPPDRLRLLADAYADADHDAPWVASYTRGHFVNLRTLYGHAVELDAASDNPFWGGGLTFNQAAYRAASASTSADVFASMKFPGYDREFVRRLRSIPTCQMVSIPSANNNSPVAFSHGKNVATWLQHKGSDMREQLQEWLPKLVWDEVLRSSEFLHERRVFPPWSKT